MNKGNRPDGILPFYPFTHWGAHLPIVTQIFASSTYASSNSSDGTHWSCNMSELIVKGAKQHHIFHRCKAWTNKFVYFCPVLVPSNAPSLKSLSSSCVQSLFSSLQNQAHWLVQRVNTVCCLWAFKPEVSKYLTRAWGNCAEMINLSWPHIQKRGRKSLV